MLSVCRTPDLSMERHALLTSITTLEVRKAELLKELELVDLNLKIQRAEYSRQLNEDAAIYNLPNELLTGIFMSCQQATRPKRGSARMLPLQVIVSHVSHRWRDIALATPLLWNTIDFNVRPMNHVQKRTLSQLEAHLDRSGECFLDITLNFHVVNELSAYFELLGAHSKRWRRLSIVKRYEQVDDIVGLLRDAPTPMLEHLSLNLGKPQEGSLSPRKKYYSVAPSIFTLGAPRLTFVRLAGLALGILHPPTTFVTTLHLDGWTRHFMTHDQFRDVFAAAPLLVNLSLNQLCIHHSRDPFALLQPAHLPHLRCLRIRGPCSPLSRLISSMNMPQLYALSLQSVDTFDSDILRSVESLCLDSCAFDEQEIGNLISALPSVTYLSIDDSMPDIFFMLYPEPTAESTVVTTTLAPGPSPSPNAVTGSNTTRPWPWPYLRTLAVRDLQSADVTHLCGMLLSRRAGHGKGDGSGSAVRTVLLDRRSRSVLRTRDRYELVKERFELESADSPEPWPWPGGLGYEDAHDLLE